MLASVRIAIATYLKVVKFGESPWVDMVFLSLLRPKDLEHKFQKSPR